MATTFVKYTINNRNQRQNHNSEMYSIAKVSLFIFLSVVQGTSGSNCVRHGVDYGGADLSKFRMSSFEECQKTCRKKEACHAITYSTSEKWCWLKHRRGGEAGPTLRQGLISTNMVCDNKSDHTCAKENVDYPGADMGQRAASSLLQCEQFCRDSEQCRSITYHDSSKSCWLKYRKSGRQGPINHQGLVSLNMDCPEGVIQDCLNFDTDFGGADLTSLKTETNNMGKCKGFCREEPSCLSFTYRSSDGQCWLKYRKFGTSGHTHKAGYISMNMYCN